MRRTMTIPRALLRDCRCATVREADIIIPSSPHMHKPPLHCALCSSMPSSHDQTRSFTMPNLFIRMYSRIQVLTYTMQATCVYIMLRVACLT